MERLGKAVIATGMLALAAGACFSDPTSDLRNGATRIQFSRAFVLQGPGDTDVVTITLLDDQGNSIAFDDPTLVAVNAGIADIQPLPDSTLRRIPGNTLYKAIVVGVGAGQSFLRVTAGGVTDSISAVVTPVTLDVTFSPASPGVGDTVTITATGSVTFSGTATATFAGGYGFLDFVSRSATQLKYIAGAAGTGTVTIQGGILLGSIPLPPTPSTTALTTTATQANEPANDAPATGPVLTIPAAVGDSIVVYGGLDDVDIDDFFTLTPTTGDSVRAVLTWQNSGADVDLLITDAGVTGCIQGCSGATGAHPEVDVARLVGGTTYRIWLNMYDTGGVTVPVGWRLMLRKVG